MQQQKNTRKPSGFSGAGQPKKRAPQAAAPAPQPKKIKKAKIKKEKAPVTKRGEKKGLLGRVLGIGLVLVLIAMILIVIFGNHGTYHQMPIITREEAQPSFEPEKTPMPGVQEAI